MYDTSLWFRNELLRSKEVEEVDDGIDDWGSKTEDIVLPNDGYEDVAYFCDRNINMGKDIETIWLDTHISNIRDLREGTLSSTFLEQKNIQKLDQSR
ncbi:hypothetical protein FQA39_LY10807 [Lamprigera yunnana]|nr:hypothetical protein FQA39_LY10807 [Lamprigera yunnana]